MAHPLLDFPHFPEYSDFLKDTLAIDLGHWVAANRTHQGLEGFLQGLAHHVMHHGGIGYQTHLVGISKCKLYYPLIFSHLERWAQPHDATYRPRHQGGVCGRRVHHCREPFKGSLFAAWENNFKKLIAAGFCPSDTMFLLYLGDAPMCNGVMPPEPGLPQVSQIITDGWSLGNPACGVPVFHSQRSVRHVRECRQAMHMDRAIGDLPLPNYSVFTSDSPGEAARAQWPSGYVSEPPPEAPSTTPWSERPSPAFARDTDFCSFFRNRNHALIYDGVINRPATRLALFKAFHNENIRGCQRRIMAVLAELHPQQFDTCQGGLTTRPLATAIVRALGAAFKLQVEGDEGPALDRRKIAKLYEDMTETQVAERHAGAKRLFEVVGKVHALLEAQAASKDPTLYDRAQQMYEQWSHFRDCERYPLSRFADRKYLVVAEGWASTWKLQHLAHFDTVNIVLTSCTELYFQPAYKPWMHYVPATTQDLPDLLAELERNDTIAEVGRQGAQFAERYLSRDARWAYMYLALDTTTRLLYQPHGMAAPSPPRTYLQSDDGTSHLASMRTARSQRHAILSHLQSPKAAASEQSRAPSVFTELFETLQSKTPSCAAGAFVWMIANYDRWRDVGKLTCGDLEQIGQSKDKTVAVFVEAFQRSGGSHSQAQVLKDVMMNGLSETTRTWTL